MNFQLNKNIEHTIIQDVKQMRNLESHWQTGKIFFRENDQKISIKFVTKKSNQIFLTRDLFKNNVAYYNKNEFILAAIHPFDKTVRPQVLTKNHNFSYLKLSCL